MTEDFYPKAYLYRRVVQAKLFIDNHFAEQIDLADIASEASFSKFHFVRLFKKVIGKTPHRYLTSVRIEAAKKLLQSDMPVTEVCFAVGFDSLGSFITLFKKIAGQTPSEYRRQQLERKADISAKPIHFVPDCFAEAKGWKKAISEK